MTNRQTSSRPKPWCKGGGVLNLHHDNDVKEVVSSQPSVTWYKSTNQKIRIRTVCEILIIKDINQFSPLLFTLNFFSLANLRALTFL